MGLEATGGEAPGAPGATGAPTPPWLTPRVPWSVRLAQWRGSRPGWPLLFTVTLFVSSALLFAVQPMFAKMVLPRLGGTPATWITCLLFFQSALLAGYAYAHWSASSLGPRAQPLVHGALLLGALAVLPVAVPSGWTPGSAGAPVGWLLALLVVSVGLPFFVVASTAPLLQRWFAGVRHPAAEDPYFLYRASNVGSMLALLAYPVLIEPGLRLADQSRLWTAGYLGLVVLTAWCALAPRSSAFLARSSTANDGRRAEDADGEGHSEDAGSEPLGLGRRARWVALAFVPSSFMLAVTTYITTEIAAVPLLWIIPLAIYLLSFIVVFARKPFLLSELAGQLQVVVVLELVFLVLLEATEPVLLVVATILVALFLSALVCHARLADDRPPSGRLTEFYLWVAVGGALGGVFNAVVAPVAFDSVVEYPLAIVLACLLRPPRASPPRSSRSRRPAWPQRSGRLDLAVPAAIGVATLALVGLGRAAGLESVTARGVAFAAALLACAVVYSRPVRFGLAVGAVLVAGALASGADRDTLYADRTFFGVLRVDRDDSRHLHRLVHGNTMHGAQSLEPARRLEPLTYYDRSGPVGDVFRSVPVAASATDVGVIGLGTGTLACYGRPGQHWTFYEIDPAVEDIARDPRLFTYLRDCPPASDVRLGDARLSITEAPAGRFGMIFVDAFNSDSLPVHLITRQALAVYLDRMADGGVVVVNVTNRYLDLRPVIGALARDAGLTGVVRDDLRTTDEDRARAKTGSMWIALARRPADLGPLVGDPRWEPLPVRSGARAWTDDFSNLVDAIKRG
jgi:hypothetical protein